MNIPIMAKCGRDVVPLPPLPMKFRETLGRAVQAFPLDGFSPCYRGGSDSFVVPWAR